MNKYLHIRSFKRRINKMQPNHLHYNRLMLIIKMTQILISQTDRI